MIFWGDNDILKVYKRCDNNLPLIFILRCQLTWASHGGGDIPLITIHSSDRLLPQVVQLNQVIQPNTFVMTNATLARDIVRVNYLLSQMEPPFVDFRKIMSKLKYFPMYRNQWFFLLNKTGTQPRTFPHLRTILRSTRCEGSSCSIPYDWLHSWSWRNNRSWGHNGLQQRRNW